MSALALFVKTGTDMKCLFCLNRTIFQLNFLQFTVFYNLTASFLPWSQRSSFLKLISSTELDQAEAIEKRKTLCPGYVIFVYSCKICADNQERIKININILEPWMIIEQKRDLTQNTSLILSHPPLYVKLI